MLDNRFPIPTEVPVEITLTDGEVLNSEIAAVTTMVVVILGERDYDYIAIPYVNIKKITWEG